MGFRKSSYKNTEVCGRTASRNRDSGALETNIPDTETAFDWLDDYRS